MYFRSMAYGDHKLEKVHAAKGKLRRKLPLITPIRC